MFVLIAPYTQVIFIFLFIHIIKYMPDVEQFTGP